MRVFNYTMGEVYELTTDPEDTFYLDDIINRFYRAENLSNNELALMYYGYAYTPDYKPYRWLIMENKILELNNTYKHKDALKMCDSLLMVCPFSLIGLAEKSYAHGRLDEKEKSKKTKLLYNNIRNMVLKSGDGLSRKTAYKILSWKEIELITDYRGMLVLDRKSVNKKGFHYEECEVFYKGEKMKIYFDITLIQTLGYESF